MDINANVVKTDLEKLIAEHDEIYPPAQLETKRDYYYGEMLMLNHARNHLNVVIDKNDPEFIDNNGNIKHQSDIVKEALQRIPKTDYSPSLPPID
jgi:hypothetical protein